MRWWLSHLKSSPRHLLPAVSSPLSRVIDIPHTHRHTSPLPVSHLSPPHNLVVSPPTFLAVSPRLLCLRCTAGRLKKSHSLTLLGPPASSSASLPTPLLFHALHLPCPSPCRDPRGPSLFPPTPPLPLLPSRRALGGGAFSGSFGNSPQAIAAPAITRS